MMRMHAHARLALCLAAWAAAMTATSSAAEPATEKTSGSTDHCRSRTTCRSCIRTPDCHWCSSHVIEIGASRDDESKCVHKTEAVGSWCKGTPWSPVGSYEIIANNTPDKESQIYPKHAKLVLRVGETRRVHVTFKKRNDYPIDLYYLMDLSESMRDDKNQLSKLGNELAAAMREVTSNFRIGFGSFVDKVEMPFVFTDPYSLKFPCSKSICATPYSFKNHMPLNNDTTLFSKEVEKTPISTNNDNPEGGLDALMQAIVCTEKIQWRSDARHLLIFTTDAPYHIAGDGKLAGAVEPNPEVCNVNAQNEYTRSTDYDYPTISQINKKALENQIMILFAVRPKGQHLERQYADLSERIEGSRMEILSQSSKNIIGVIREVYDKFDRIVKLGDDAGSKSIGIVYYAHCSNNKELIRTNECNNVTGSSPVSFEVDVTVKSCPLEFKGQIWNTTININPRGIKESLQLDLEVFCSCPCEYEGDKLYKGKSSTCHNQGIQKCGICECLDGWHGKTCECDRSSRDTEENKFSACITDKRTKTICFGRGTCKCGKCSCDERTNPDEVFYGKFCECDNFSCNRYDGKLCSGPGRGRCSCGKCNCEAGWTGEACECPEMQTGCVAPGEDKVCSGFGSCVCGKCKCKEDRSGKYCGECMQTLNVTCAGGRCKEFADCVECMVHETGRHAKTSCSSCSISKPKLEDIIHENNKSHPEERFCKVPDDAGCSFVFTYLEFPTLSLRAEKTKECSMPINLLGIVLGISGTTLFLAILALLIWKLLTSIHDRREYEKYLLELENTKWAAVDNPQYQEPTTTTMNPTYHSRRSRFSFMLR